MALRVFRSNRLEALSKRLAAVLRKRLPPDPFAPVAVVVGSRGMADWLRLDLATCLGICARVEFPFPRPAFLGAARWLLGKAPDDGPFWNASEQDEPWTPDSLAFRVLELVRDNRDHPDFAPIGRYLGRERLDPDSPVDRRLLGFARDAADVLDKLMHELPERAVAWAREPAAVPPEDRWLARLPRGLGAHRSCWPLIISVSTRPPRVRWEPRCSPMRRLR